MSEYHAFWGSTEGQHLERDDLENLFGVEQEESDGEEEE